jgi:hypothetical protein
VSTVGENGQTMPTGVAAMAAARRPFPCGPTAALARAVMALASLGIAAAASPNLATTVLLTDYVNSTGARCLDGSPQRYWIQPSASTACVRNAACAGPAHLPNYFRRLCD